MVDLLAAIVAVALLGGAVSAIVAAVGRRFRLAITLGAAGLGGAAIAFVLLVAAIFPTVERRVGFLGAIAAFAGLAMLSVPFLVTVLSKKEPRWAGPLTSAGRVLAVVGLAGVVIYGVTSLRHSPG